MGKCMRKCKGIGEVAAMEMARVGVRTRARALAMARENSVTVQRRNVGALVSQHRNRGGIPVTPENSASQMASLNDRCRSSASDNAPVSCCSSNGSTDLERRSKCIDLAEENVAFKATSAHNTEIIERRETTPSSELQPESGDLESTVKSSGGSGSRRRSTAVYKMPSDSELEEFFAAAEKTVQKQFTEKYNYDVVKDEPLEGCFEWIRVKP